MKKLTFVLVALLTLAFTGCKVETSKVTVSVTDKAGAPLADRYVFYADVVSVALEELAPSPESLITDTSDAWDAVSTNAQGTVEFNINLGVSKLSYYFMTYDYGKLNWEIKTVELHRGKNADIVLEINK
jgi:hypothetical protein